MATLAVCLVLRHGLLALGVAQSIFLYIFFEYKNLVTFNNLFFFNFFFRNKSSSRKNGAFFKNLVFFVSFGFCTSLLTFCKEMVCVLLISCCYVWSFSLLRP